MRAGIVILLTTPECANDDVVSKIAMPACLLSKYRNRQLEFLPGPQYNQARSPIAPTLTWNRAHFPKSAKALDDARRAAPVTPDAAFVVEHREQGRRKNQEASGRFPESPILQAEEGKKLAETYQEADRSGRIELLMGVTNLLAERQAAAKDLGVL